MDAKTSARLSARARILKALAHPSRLLIVDELARGERCVCELTGMIGADMSTVSRHLSVLRSAGVVRDDKRGQQIFYRLRDPAIGPLLAGIGDLLRSFAAEQLELVKSA
jgi:DNA-binding transcriptional ArsR family regulator